MSACRSQTATKGLINFSERVCARVHVCEYNCHSLRLRVWRGSVQSVIKRLISRYHTALANSYLQPAAWIPTGRAHVSMCVFIFFPTCFHVPIFTFPLNASQQTVWKIKKTIAFTLALKWTKHPIFCAYDPLTFLLCVLWFWVCAGFSHHKPPHNTYWDSVINILYTVSVSPSALLYYFKKILICCSTVCHTRGGFREAGPSVVWKV